MIKLILGCFISSSVFAWNATAHRLIGELALHDLNETTRAKVARDFKDASTNVADVSTWLDDVRAQRQYRNLRYYHYIGIPFGRAHYFPKKTYSKNGLTAIQTAQKVLKNPKSNAGARLYALKILFHVVGDLHQPMHTAIYYSSYFKHGDSGGNLYRLPKKTGYSNLHQLWDDGAGGMSALKPSQFYAYQCDKNDTFVLKWIEESHQIATQSAYFPPRSREKMKIYKNQVCEITKKQIPKAACRLAAILEDAYR
jgi:hypothetical protein